MLVETLGYHRNCSKSNKFLVLQRQNHGIILKHCIQSEIKYDNTNPKLVLTVCVLLFFTWAKHFVSSHYRCVAFFFSS